jgi:hypothetical protein
MPCTVGWRGGSARPTPVCDPHALGPRAAAGCGAGAGTHQLRVVCSKSKGESIGIQWRLDSFMLAIDMAIMGDKNG